MVGFSVIGIYVGPVFGGFAYIVNTYVGYFDDDYMHTEFFGGGQSDAPTGQSCSLGYRTKLRSTAVRQPHVNASSAMHLPCRIILNKSVAPARRQVWIDTNDSYMTGCYLHCTAMGLHLGGSVSTIINNHFTTNWDWSGGGVYLPSGVDNNRFIGNYFDFTTLVVDDPLDFLFTDGYFLLEYYPIFGDLNFDQSFISLRPTEPNKTVSGLRITDCQVDIGGGAKPGWVQINHTAFMTATKAPSFSGAHNSVVSGNVFNEAAPRNGTVGTRVAQSLFQTNATSWVFNLTSSLLFTGIRGSVIYSFAAAGAATAPPPQHWLAQDGAHDGVVEVRSVSPATARVYIQVDQSDYAGGVV